MILSAIWSKLNEFTELHKRSECNSLNEFNLFQMARKIISFDNNQMGQLPPPSPTFASYKNLSKRMLVRGFTATV